MKKLKNLSEEETIQVITNVVDRIAPKYTFNGYETEDMKQEAYIICLEALERYDSTRPLENFLSVNLSNRLKNFIRDNFGNAKDVEKKKVNAPLNIPNAECCLPSVDFFSESIENREIYNIIDKKIPTKLREDFLKFTNGVYINKIKKQQLLKVIQEILDEEG